MTTDTSPRTNRVRGSGEPPRTRGARPPGQTLLRAAEELFGERSYPSTSMRDLRDYMTYNQSTQGHLNSDGLCFVKRNYPSPQ